MTEDISESRRPELAPALQDIEQHLLGEEPSLTRRQVSERAGVPIEIAEELWRLLGFPRQDDDVVAFTQADVRALEQASELVRMGILSPDRQAALVRTWGRSFARLAEWQTKLLTEVALESGDPVGQLDSMTEEVLPRVEALQDYVWRRHLYSATARMMTSAEPGADTAPLAVVFCDIVGFTSRSKEMDESALVGWIEYFEAESTGLVVDTGGRIIKNIGDEVLFVADDLAAAAEAALTMVERGVDEDDDFPPVRAGLAYGDVVSRLGDVFGSTVNIAARLTSVARPGTVLVDDGAHDALADASAYTFRHLHRVSVKGYSHLRPWALRRAAS